MLYTSINTITVGDVTIIPAVAGQRWIIYQALFRPTGLQTLTFRSGANLLLGPFEISSLSWLTLPFTGIGWWQGGLGEAFIINKSDTDRLSGTVVFNTYTT